MHFAIFAQHLQKLEAVSARLAITAELAQLYQELSVAEITPASYLLQGQLRPQFDSLEFQLSTKMVQRALVLFATDKGEGEATNLFGDKDTAWAEKEVTKLFHKYGDLGDAAAELVTHGNSSTSLVDVYSALEKIAQATGAGSQDKKVQSLVELLNTLDGVGAKYLVRIVLGKLRLGFATMTMIDALSWAIHGDKRDSEALETAYNKRADIGELASAYLGAKTDADRAEVLTNYSVKVGVPVLPALCQRLGSAAEVIEKMGEVIVEPKYDGVRVQLHFDRRGEVAIKTFTRSLEENSHQFPELDHFASATSCQSCILDGEAIGYDPETGLLRPFQETITRKRKHAVDEQAAQIPLKFFFFDVLLLDNKPTIDLPLRERKDLLGKLFKKNEYFLQTPYELTDQPDVVRNLHEEYLAENLEGVVIKQVSSPYSSGRKGWQWVKMKEAEGSRGKLKDTLDCVVMGYYRGEGKRHDFGLGAFLVGVLDGDGQVKTIAKIGTGLSDDQFRELKQRTDPLLIDTKPAAYQVAKTLEPDHWTKPGLVVEIAADELTRSPLHSAGLALRFPRLVRFRDDKTWEQATTIQELANL